MRFFSDFADQAVMMPLAMVFAACLAVTGWWRGLAAWLVAVVAVLGSLAVLKFVFFACGGLLGQTGIHSPSGHTAAAAVIFGGILLLLLRHKLAPPILASLPVAIGAAFGLSRLALGAHNLAEILVGGSVGLAGAASMVAMAGRPPALRSWRIAAAALFTMAICHGLRLPAESVIHNFAFLTWLPLPALCRLPHPALS